MLRSRLFASALLAVLAAGCGSGGRVHPVSGVVTYQSKAVEGATVNFIGADQKASFGRTDASGKFQLTTSQTNDGAPAGPYKVTISKTETTGADVKELAPGVLDPNPKLGVTRHVIPQRYNSVNTSGLTAEVTAGGKNEFTFDLK